MTRLLPSSLAHTLTILLVTLAAAGALWLSLGTLAVVGQTAGDRVGLIAPGWSFLLVAGLCGVAAFRLRASRRSFVAWLPALLLVLPWLPFDVPAAFLLWSGPLASLIWAVVIVALVGAAPPRWLQPSRGGAVGSLARLAQHPVRAPIAAALIAGALYAYAGWRLTDFLPGGDEPHYLMIAESLRRDGDLQIENNHRARQYLPYFPGELKPDFLRRGVNGQIYSIHAPGLPALLVPAVTAFGYRGAILFLALLSAAGAALVWRLAWTLTGQASAAWIGWAAAVAPAPAFFHAFTVYPDGVGALLVLTGAAAIVQVSRLTVPRALLHGAALAYLPWLHTRFALLAAALGLAIVARLAGRTGEPRAPRLRLIAAFLGVPAISAAIWFGFFYAIYGTPNPAAPYGRDTQNALANVPAGLVGLLFDQQFGLIANAPIYLVAWIALGWTAFRPRRSDDTGGRRRLAIEALAIGLPYMIATAAYQMWWGGWSAPARFLAPLLPLLALAVAVCWSAARTQTAKATLLAALAASTWLTTILLSVRHGRLAYNDRDGYALWTDWANPIVNLATGLPSLFRRTVPTEIPWPAALRTAAIWIGLLAATWIALRLIERWWGSRDRGAGDVGRVAPPPLFAAAIVPTAYAIAVMIAFSLVWRVTAEQQLRPALAQVALLQGVAEGRRPWGILDHGPRPTHVALAGAAAPGAAAAARGSSDDEAGAAAAPDDEATTGWPRIVAAGELPRHLRIGSVTRRLPRERPLLFLPNLPAGRYRLRVTADSPAAGRLDILIGRSGVPIRSFELPPARADLTGSPLELTLPITVSSLSVVPDERARRIVRHVVLQPLTIADRRVLPLPHAIALHALRYGAFTLYAASPDVYLEPSGLWVQPTSEVDLLIEPERPAQTFGVLLRNGPVENQVRLEVEAWRREVSLPAGGEQVVEVPASRRGATPLRIHAAQGFRPSDVDPTNGDHRRLGVWVELREAEPRLR